MSLPEVLILLPLPDSFLSSPHFQTAPLFPNPWTLFESDLSLNGLTLLSKTSHELLHIILSSSIPYFLPSFGRIFLQSETLPIWAPQAPIHSSCTAQFSREISQYLRLRCTAALSIVSMILSPRVICSYPFRSEDLIKANPLTACEYSSPLHCFQLIIERARFWLYRCLRLQYQGSRGLKTW